MKINNKGFVLAETLVVTVFVMAIFSIIYANFYPIQGKYREREYYDDIDSKYNVYWMKRLIQDDSIVDDSSWAIIKDYIAKNGGFEFYCTSATDPNTNCPFVETDKINLVLGFMNTTNVKHVYITKYNLERTTHIDSESAVNIPQFKGKTTNTYIKKFDTAVKVSTYNGKHTPTDTYTANKIGDEEDSSSVPTAFKEYFIYSALEQSTLKYINNLPAYKFPSQRGSNYRVIAEFSKIKDDSSDKKNYVRTYANIELKRD